MSSQPTIQFSKPLRVNLHRDMTPPKVKIECGDIVVADCIGNPDHADRIAACVNALAGIADPHAAIQVIEDLRYALNDLLEWAKNWDSPFMDSDEFDESIYTGALAKAKSILP